MRATIAIGLPWAGSSRSAESKLLVAILAWLVGVAGFEPATP
jgi:hypothetical protein